MRRLQCTLGSRDWWEFLPLSKGHWQSLISAAQGDHMEMRLDGARTKGAQYFFSKYSKRESTNQFSNQYCHVINKVLWHVRERNFTEIAQLLNLCRGCKYCIFIITATSHRSQWSAEGPVPHVQVMAWHRRGDEQLLSKWRHCVLASPGKMCSFEDYFYRSVSKNCGIFQENVKLVVSCLY